MGAAVEVEIDPDLEVDFDPELGLEVSFQN